MNNKSLKTLEYTKIIARLEAYASTPDGKKMCRELLPMTDPLEIKAALAQVTDARFRISANGSVSFSGVKEIGSSLLRLNVGSSLGALELLHIASTLDAALRAKAYGRRAELADPDSLSPLFEMIEPLTPVNNEIKRCILSEEEIADDASPALKSIRRQIRLTNEKVHNQLSSLLNSARAYLQDDVITMRDGRYCLPVRAEYKSSVPGLIHDQSGTGSTFFVEPMSVVNLNNELKELQIKENKEIEIILSTLSSMVGEHTAEIANNITVLSKLDFIFAKAYLSESYKGCAPGISDDHSLNIKKARHPLLNSGNPVPIDVRLGEDFDMLVITGPNTGGKTVTLKTIGLFTLMGQAGLHIPAGEGSKIAVFDDVFADIGDEQSIEQSLSTFSAHMTNIVSILNEANENSLILFDELGAGTDPTEGAALAISILTGLHQNGIRTAATTHYSELKIFALSTPGVSNACCEFDVASLRPTYKLLIGMPGKSNAFEISKKLGLSEDVIERARQSIGENNEAFEDVISDLESRRKNIEEAETEAERLKKEIAALKTELSEKQERIEAQRDRIIAQAKEEARATLQEAKDAADKAIRALNKSGIHVSRETEEIRSGLRESIDRLSPAGLKQKKSGKLNAGNLHIGDGIKVLSLGINGTVSSLPDDKGNLFVQMGILRSQVNINDIELCEQEDEKISKGVRSSGVLVSKSLSVSTEINLVGMHVDEAMSELDKYLDDAYLAHVPSVRIIHGRGTGTLKQAVQSMLRKNKHVSSYRAGEYNEGGYGVTIAEFK